MIYFLTTTPGGLAILIGGAYPALILMLILIFFVFLMAGRGAPGKLGLFLTNIAISFDQMANVFLFGDPDDTISARDGRSYAWGVLEKKSFFWWVLWMPLWHLLDWVDPGHSAKYALADKSEGRRALFGFRKLQARHWIWLRKQAALA